MKKFISASLSLILVISAVFVPLQFTASAAENGFSGVYSFDFSEQGVFDYSPYIDTENNKYKTATYNGKTYYPIYTYGTTDVATRSTVGYEKLVIGEEEFDAMKLTSDSNTNTNLTAVTLMQNGHPIQLEEGVTYTVSYTMYVKTAGEHRRVTLGAGGLPEGLSAFSVAQTNWRCDGFSGINEKTMSITYPYSIEAFYSTPAVSELRKCSNTVQFTVGPEELQNITRIDGGTVNAKTVNNFFELTFGKNNMTVYLTELTLKYIPEQKPADLDKGYTFNFSEENIFNYSEFIDTENDKFVTTKYGDKTYYPFYTYRGSEPNTQSSAIGYEKLSVEGKELDALKVTSDTDSYTNTTFVTLMGNGQPIQLDEGKTYRVTYTLYATTNPYRRIAFGAGGSSKYASYFSFASGAWQCDGFDGITPTRKSAAYPYSFDAFYTNSKISTLTKFSGTKEFTVGPAELQNLVRTDGGAVSPVTVNNFFEMTFASGVTVYLTELSIVNVPTVTLVSANGTETKLGGTVGSKIDFSPYINVDYYTEKGTGHTAVNTWYKDAELTQPVDINNEAFTSVSGVKYYAKEQRVDNFPANQLSYVGFEENITLNEYIHWGITRDKSNFTVVDGGKVSAKALKYKQVAGKSATENKILNISHTAYFADKVTYNVSFWYKSNAEVTFGITAAENNNTLANITTVSAPVAAEWTKLNITYTPDFGEINQKDLIPALIVNEKVDNTETEVYIDNISIMSLITDSAVSILKSDIAKAEDAQAMRVYYNYLVNDDGTVNINGENKSVSERGILVAATADKALLSYENIGKAGVLHNSKTENLNEVWAYSDNKITYSNYVKNFTLADNRSVSYRGYIVTADGTVYYSSVTDYSVAKLLTNEELLTAETTYSFTDSDVLSKVKFQSATEKTKKGITFDWSNSTAVVTANATGKVVFTMAIYNNPYKHNFAVFVDGIMYKNTYNPVLLDSDNDLYTVTVDLGANPGVHKVELMRNRQAAEGIIDLVSVTLNGTLLKTEQNDILIEFIGDSITCGVGNMVNDNGMQWSMGSQVYSCTTAQKLGFDWRTRAKGGIGFMYSSGGGTGIGSEWISSYNVENPWRDHTTPYSEEREADIVCIYLGTNDSGGWHAAHGSDDWGINDTNRQDWYDNMARMTEIVKEHNPGAKIIWISGGMTTAPSKTAGEAMEQLGGEAAGYYHCQLPGSMTSGGDGHPTAAQQQIMAQSFESFLLEKGLV